MKKLFEKVVRKWWSQVGVDLVDPYSETSLMGLHKVLAENFSYEFANEYVKQLLEGGGLPKAAQKEEPAGEKDVESIELGMMTSFERDKYKEKSEEQDLDEDTWVKNKKSGSVYQVKQLNPQTQDPATKDDVEKAKQKGKESDSSDEVSGEPASEERIIAGKDKTLIKTNSLESKAFTQEMIPDDAEFEKKNAKLANPTPPDAFKIPDDLVSNPKFPKRYLKALERMMNTRPTGDATKWSHFSDIPGGAGQISAQAGELMTMMGTSMSNDEFTKLTDALSAHETALIKNNPSLKTEGSRIVTKSWIQAAKNNRQAILNRISSQYPGAEIVATSWDTKDEVQALGLKNYNKNKGFSSDMYAKIKLQDGSEILDEVSLKKSTMVNFLNSGAGKFSEWDTDLPDEINQKVYSSNQRKGLSDFGSKFSNDIKKLIDSNDPAAKSVIDTMKSKKISFDDALNDLAKGGGSRSKNKVVLEGIKALADSGNEDAKQYMKNVDETHREFQAESVKAIVTNPKMKAGMLEEIKKEFPLKSVSDGEETMAIGPNSLDKKVMEKIFGTSDFEQIKEKLVAEDGNPPYLGYKADLDGKVIPLATIVVREDGVGYGGQIKFEMQLDKRFAKTLETANKDIYSK
jgi:hypothetical protein